MAKDKKIIESFYITIEASKKLETYITNQLDKGLDTNKSRIVNNLIMKLKT